MAEKKKSTQVNKKSPGARSAPAKTEKRRLGDDIIPSVEHERQKPLKMPKNPDSAGNQILLCAIGLAGILLLACFLLTDMSLGAKGLTGPAGYYISLCFYGLFGMGAYIVPVATVIYAAMWKHSVRRGKTLSKAVLLLIFSVLVSSVVHLAFAGFASSQASSLSFYDIKGLWISGAQMKSGGVLGGFFGGMFKTCLNIIAWPVTVLLLLGVIMFIFEITPNMVAYCVRQLARDSGDRHKAKKQEKRGVKAEREEERRQQRALEARERELRRLEKQEEIAERERRFYEERNKKKVTDIDIDPVSTVSTEAPVKKAPVSTETPVKKMPVSTVVTATVNQTSTQEILPEIETKKSNKATHPDEPARTKEEEKHQKTVQDVKIHDVFTDNPKRKKTEYNGVSDVNGNEKPDFEQSYDVEIKDVNNQGANEQEIEELVDTLGDEDINEIQDTPEEIGDIDDIEEIEEIEELPVNKQTGEIYEKPSKVKATREKVIPSESKDEPATEPEKEDEPSYVLPPITLLEVGDEGGDTGYSDEILERNGRRLVETLRSFKVDVEIAHISKGPTITRYELVPKAGVRVRSIANLVDDIALALETQGIRIEAPIPGKAAVGIEVPNKNLSTVYLRSLIDTDTFRSHKSKLNCCLGKNVSGEPVFLDIAKMPHLLIAGATGMGKSVCINSLLISLLYKASPDEVKLILIDPKKVELNVYNKLPHLLVPVVNQPKYAAGSLSWAVGEMERRFELIEEVGVRDIAGYNKVTANDPQKEFLPQIVIIIDELADLMMTAPVDVEQSIIRLAQKARAAGMHLIIGTQRPSVDVITGLIKANVPSRIAFTVASNIDSRTIIDVAGAEKLIGRGDMLFAPVGAMKPIRVQGSFVSDAEVERVTEFIKAQAQGKYDPSIMKDIDTKAKQCGQKKKSEAEVSEGSATGELDEKFFEAVDIALEEGKVSTSLLQRRIKVGYSRAASIIDTMQEMGIVSAPEGMKPRSVLISRQDWDEMVMRLDGGSSAESTDGDYDEGGAGGLGEDEFDDDAPF